VKTSNAGERFPGFERRVSVTPLPETFFTILLPQIDDLGELKITLYAFWALARQQTQHPYLTRSGMLADERLLESLGEGGADALDDALQRALQRGVLLQAVPEFANGADTLYFLNSARGRLAAAAVHDGTWQPAFEPQPFLPTSERLNIFVLYEQNIGPLTPIIAEHLKDAEDEYPPAWIEEAFGIAVNNNVRKWTYIEAILRDWQDRGKDGRENRQRTPKDERDYSQGWFDE